MPIDRIDRPVQLLIGRGETVGGATRDELLKAREDFFNCLQEVFGSVDQVLPSQEMPCRELVAKVTDINLKRSGAGIIDVVLHANADGFFAADRNERLVLILDV